MTYAILHTENEEIEGTHRVGENGLKLAILVLLRERNALTELTLMLFWIKFLL